MKFLVYTNTNADDVGSQEQEQEENALPVPTGSEQYLSATLESLARPLSAYTPLLPDDVSIWDDVARAQMRWPRSYPSLAAQACGIVPSYASMGMTPTQAEAGRRLQELLYGHRGFPLMENFTPQWKPSSPLAPTTLSWWRRLAKKLKLC